VQHNNQENNERQGYSEFQKKQASGMGFMQIEGLPSVVNTVKPVELQASVFNHPTKSSVFNLMKWQGK